jgi:cob(I)alamin adenosyltransferase
MTDPAGGKGPFSDPKLAINRIYTKKGDAGHTQLVGGQDVSKTEPRIEAYGTVDELNAFVGQARLSVLAAAEAAMVPDRKGRLATLAAELLRVQHELFNLGSVLATLPEDLHPKQPRVTEVEVKALEASIDVTQDVLTPLRSFVLPGGCRPEADLHVARTVCRRAERLVVALAATSEVEPAAIRYLNRLSDAFFAWSRLATWATDAEEVLWRPNAAASAQGG